AIDARDESRAGSPLPSVSRLRKIRATHRSSTRSDAFRSAGGRVKCAAGRNGRCRNGGTTYDAVVAELKIPPSVATSKFVLLPARRPRRRIIRAYNRSHHCAGGVSACAHWSGREHRGAGTRGVFA